MKDEVDRPENVSFLPQPSSAKEEGRTSECPRQTDGRNWAQMLGSAIGAHDDALHVKCYEQRTRRRRETNVHSPILLRRRGNSYVEELVGSCEPKVFAQSNAQ